MKKAVVLGMILLALGVMAYADGTTVGLDFGRSQFNLASSSSASGAPINSGWMAPGTTFPQGQRLDMQFAWQNDHTGINITNYLTNGGTASSKIVNANGTLKLVPDMFTFKMGLFSGDGFDDFRADSAHPIRDISNGNVGRFSGWGLIGILQPKDSGFELGLFYQSGDPADANGHVATVAETAANTSLAASYTVPNTVKITAGTSTAAAAQSAVADPTGIDRANRNIFGRVALLMVPNLNTWADVRYDGFDQPTKVSNINAEWAGDYEMKPLSIIWAALFGHNEIAGVKINSWQVEPELIYNMGGVSLGVVGNVFGTDISGSGIGIGLEPYVKLNDFGLRVSFNFATNTQSGAISTWEIPILVDWGF